MTWLDRAVCVGMPSWWFERRKYDLAIAVCERCPVRYECLADALDTPADQDHGIRGGLTRNQRNGLRGQR